MAKLSVRLQDAVNRLEECEDTRLPFWFMQEVSCAHAQWKFDSMIRSFIEELMTKTDHFCFIINRPFAGDRIQSLNVIMYVYIRACMCVLFLGKATCSRSARVDTKTSFRQTTPLPLRLFLLLTLTTTTATTLTAHYDYTFSTMLSHCDALEH